MLNVICDICKKSVPGAKRETTYFTALNKNMCLDCKLKLENKVKEEMAAAKAYRLVDYKKVFTNNLMKLCK
jgi:hypothetical protein